MDVIQPQVYWIGKRCYRKNVIQSENEFIDRQTDDDSWKPQGNYAENDDFDLETCDADIPISKLDDGRFRASMTIPSEFFSRIIGKSGENKSQMEKETKTQINVPKKGKSGDIVVTGSDHKGVAAAYSQITLLVSSIRKRYPFTHFISIPLQSLEVKTGFSQFQEDVLSLMKRSTDVGRKLFQNPSKLHLTIGTLVLLNDDERKKASDVLLSCMDGIRNILGCEKLEIEVCGIEIMNDDPERVDVLYGKCMDPTNRLQRLADFLMESFVNSGLMERQFDRVKVHATLMNTLFKTESDDGLRPTFNARPILEEFRDYSFGKQRIEEVHLSQRHSASKSTGYYVATSQIKLDES